MIYVHVEHIGCAEYCMLPHKLVYIAHVAHVDNYGRCKLQAPYILLRSAILVFGFWCDIKQGGSLRAFCAVFCVLKTARFFFSCLVFFTYPGPGLAVPATAQGSAFLFANPGSGPVCAPGNSPGPAAFRSYTTGYQILVGDKYIILVPGKHGAHKATQPRCPGFLLPHRTIAD